eukprot:1926496-Rhodomonas_salina.2
MKRRCTKPAATLRAEDEGGGEGAGVSEEEAAMCAGSEEAETAAVLLLSAKLPLFLRAIADEKVSAEERVERGLGAC